jgi:hypothetical protein
MPISYLRAKIEYALQSRSRIVWSIEFLTPITVVIASIPVPVVEIAAVIGIRVSASAVEK